ncbi:histone H1-like repetitive region-containing protein [Nocardioides xinjiangensis]|uniref:histone H1-like repetitive region-containing protein n=1 Tax=Nocardioides xinjiangensis TaxID=2817376 RepID=UPI001B3127E3|nr:histone H1-like repetitive region-containing protein [Nocardioides sp. SYSU D00514]
MNPIRTVTGVITHPARTAGAVAGATIGTSVGAARAGLRTTARVVGWAVERATGVTPVPAGAPWTAAPDAASDAGSETDAAPAPVVDEVLGTRTAPADGTAAKKAPAKKAAAKKAAAKKAPAEKAAAKKAPAKKAPAKKAPAKKAPAKKAPSKKAAVLAPALGMSEAEVAAGAADETVDDLTTPSGIPAAAEGFNPDTTDTDLHQPGTEPLVDPATVKAVASESEVLSRAADPDKG